MFIGDILLAHGLVTEADIAAGLERQKTNGGRLGDSLVELGKLKAEDLEAVMHGAPSAPRTLDETGLRLPDLLNLLTKAMYSASLETPSAMSDFLKVPHRTVQLLLMQAQERKLLATLGSTGTSVASDLRYTLSEKGKQWAKEALAQSQYVGPIPVSLADYSERIHRQRITNERIDRAAIRNQFGRLVVPDEFMSQIGPAVNSGRSILLYGAPGNGKTSIAEKVGSLFSDVIYIPYCVDVGGQIIKVFDSSIHKAAQSRTSTATKTSSLRREEFDRRWVACRRPFIVAGGELTLEMLDLSFDAQTGFYEAPLHIKALGRHLRDRRLRSPDRQPRSLAQPLDRAARKPGRIPEAAHRPKLLAAVRRAGDLFDEPRPARPHGPGVSAPHSLQTGDPGAEPVAIPGYLQGGRAILWTRGVG